MVSKRFLAIVLLVMIVAIAGFLVYIHLSSPSIRLNATLSRLKYGGAKEGETIEVRPRFKGAGIVIPPFKRYSLQRGLEEIAKKYRAVPKLPNWLPEGMAYAEVYIGPTDIICFSDRKIENFLFANISFEIKYGVPQPRLEDIKKTIDPNRKRLIQVRDIWVVLIPEAHSGYLDVEEAFDPSPFAYFWDDDFYYMVSARSPLTAQDLIKIIESMEPESRQS